MVLEGEFPPDDRVENEINILNKAGIEIVLACLAKKETQTKESKGKLLQIRRKKIKSFHFNLRTNNITFPLYAKWWSKFLNQVLKENNFDYIHAHDLPMLRVLDQIGYTKQYKVIVDLHENYPFAIQNYEWATNFPNRYLVRPKNWFNIEQKTLRKASKIVVLSENYKRELLNKYSYLNDEQIAVYPNVPDLEHYKGDQKEETRENSRYQTLTINYFGKMGRRRGVLTIVKALKILIKSGIHLKLLLIGPVEKRFKELFYTYINDDEVKNYIQHINWVDLTDLHAHMNSIDICISPIIKNDQHESGVANKVFLYMMFGKPVIVSNCKPQAKVIQEENCGLVFESENPSDLAEKIKYLINNPELVRKMGKNGEKAVFNKYNTDIMGDKLVKLYKKST